MTLDVTWPGDAKSLQRALGLKGPIRLTVDEVMAPVVVVGDLGSGPFADSRSCGVLGTQTAVVARNSGVLVTPGVGTTLKVSAIRIINAAAAAAVYTITIMDPTEVAAINTVATGNLTDLQRPMIAVAGVPTVAFVGSFMTIGDEAFVSGRSFDMIELPGNSSRLVEFPEAVFLDGDAIDQAGRPASVAVWHGTVNTLLRASFHCREFTNRP